MGLLGIISFLSSVAVFSPAINLILFPIAFYRIFVLKANKEVFKFKLSQKVGLILMMVALVLSGGIFIVFPAVVENFERSTVGGIPYIWLIFSSLFIGLAFDYKDLRAVVILVFVEIAVGTLEFRMGVHSFLPVKFLGETQIGDTDLLYYNRVFGLSSNSSVYAFKVLSAFAIIMAFKDRLSRKMLAVCALILLVGFITSFNRTAIIATVASLIFTYAKNIKALILIALTGAVSALAFDLQRTFTRGQQHVDLSGRDLVFGRFLEFSNEHLAIGNACRKLWMFIGGSLYHAHNSYLELLASNGIFIAILFFCGYYLFIIHGKIRESVVFLIFSLAQYGILWGLTFNDLVFAGLLTAVLQRRLSRNASLERRNSDATIAASG